MKVNKKEILTALKEDFRSSESHQQEWQAQREEWRSQSVGEEYGNEVDGKSRIVSKDIAKQISWMLPSLADPFLSSPDIVKTNPVTEEDLPGATQSELLLNTFFCRKFPRHNFIMKALKVLLTEGTVVVKTGWDYEDDEIDIQAESVAVDEYGREFIEVIDTTKIKILKNEPTAEVCRNEDIFIDPTCMDELDKCQFVIHRYETDMSTLRKDGRYKNLDKLGDQIGDTTTDADGYLSQDQTGFKFNDEPRRKLLAYEYWGYYDVDGDGEVEPIVCTWVNNTIIRLQTNPYPDNKPPFVIVPFNSIPFQMFGEALAEIIGDNQKVKTAITRGIIDNMAKSNNGQIGFARGALDDNNRRKFLKGDNFEYNGNMSQFWQGSYNQIPGSAFDMLGMQNNEIEAQTGVKSFSGGITGSALGATATGARGALDATSVRRTALVRNIAENMIKPLMRKWLAYFGEFMEPEEVIRITNTQFAPIRRDDLAGNLDIEITISTAEDNSARAEQYSFLLQTLGNNMPFEITQKVLAKIAKLARDPEMEKDIKEFKKEPDPAAEQMKQIQLERAQLENDKLRAEIERDKARAGEDRIDAQVKMAKMESEKARARKLNSDADMVDLNYVDKDHGFSSIHSANEKEKDRQHQATLAAMQIRAGDNNVGIARS
jgi:hypothetical protein